MIYEFELDKYYAHPNGRMLHIIGTVETTAFGRCYVAESPEEGLVPVGIGQTYAAYWEEISEEAWLAEFEHDPVS